MITMKDARPMTDKEAREFIIANWNKIILRSEKIGICHHYLDSIDIEKYFVYCFTEDFNCENPDESEWKEFVI